MASAFRAARGQHRVKAGLTPRGPPSPSMASMRFVASEAWQKTTSTPSPSEPEVAETGMVVGPAAKRPMEQTLGGIDRQVID